MIKRRKFYKTFSLMANDLRQRREVGVDVEMPGLLHPRCVLLAVPKRGKKDRDVPFDSN
jgi:hypothetical protein